MQCLRFIDLSNFRIKAKYSGALGPGQYFSLNPILFSLSKEVLKDCLSLLTGETGRSRL